MPQFPLLRSGAVAQYGSGSASSYRTQVHRFLDGAEQTYRWRSAPVRKWIIRATQLDDGELARVEAFFTDMRGSEGRFDFVDPITGDVRTNCSFESNELDLRSTGPQKGSVELIIRENL